MREESRPVMINENVREFLQLMQAASEARMVSRSSKVRAVADMVIDKLKKINFQEVDYYDRFRILKSQWEDALRSTGYL